MPREETTDQGVGSGKTSRDTPRHHKKGEEMMDEPFPGIDHPQQQAFLRAFMEMGNVSRACEVAKVARCSHYRWLKQHKAYREAFDIAKENAADLLEAEVYRRAVTGVEEPVGWYKGVAGGVVRRYSDVLLMFTLKALRPEKYRDRVEVSSLTNIDLSRLDDETLGRIAGGESPHSVLSSWASAARARGEDPAVILGLPVDRLKGAEGNGKQGST